ncbi:MAG TPA: ATP cone domain-containing protein, partial [Gemmataceae bacterium]
MTTPPTLPAWVTEADGRLVPFEPEQVVRALFAAGERLGRPDVFLARELTDGALLFLAENLDESPPAAREVAELVAKVVRELGHPALARAYLEVAAGGDPPGERAATSLSPAAGLPEWLCGGRGPEAVRDRAAGEFLRAVSLEEVFPPELVAAHRGGLLNLGGLEAPLELAGHVLPAVPPPGENGCGLLEAVHAARAVVGGALAIDAPEYALAQGEADPARSAAGFARELFFALCGTGLRAVVNLNPAAPPGWAGGWEGGPLFRPVGPPSADRLRAARAALLRELTAPGPAGLPPGALRVAWHVSERGFQPGRQGELREAVRLAVEGRPVDFHLDRPRRPVFLGDGLERERPSVLMEVGLCLNWLAGQVA